VVTTPEIAKVLKYAYYFSTFGGNPVCTAAGLAVLNAIEKQKLQQNAHVVGSYLKDRLNSLMEKHESEYLFSFQELWIMNTITNMIFYYGSNWRCKGKGNVAWS
jgi:adenosylmethionine-8-amino-7-oxononanoate aminotransferase